MRTSLPRHPGPLRWIMAAWVVGVLAVTCAAGAPETPAPGACHALLLGAMPGQPRFAEHYRDWLKRFHAYLTQTAKVPAANVTVLSGDKEFKDPMVTGLATAESVRKALADLAGMVRAQDQVILFIVGHGVVTDRVPTLVLPGPDVSAADLAQGLGALPATNQVVLNLSSASGTAVSHLARKGRVTVSATSPIEGNEPVYPEFFLRGLESGRADGEGAPAAGTRDGVVTVLEAYNWAAHQAALWVSRLTRTEGGQWQIEGKESIEVFEKLYGGPSSPFRLAAGVDRTKPDTVVAIVPKTGKIDESWLARRVLSEHAMLEDCGEELGVAAVRTEGYEPLAGTKPREPGSLARRVVLGRADLLPPSQ
ncbi:MAG TPA: hypothetical protein VM431_05080 [Phycisphaerae bacterium]|nr:hypothetical protein [Phycisphaerae bacterium]